MTTKDKIIESAKAIFHQRGFDGARMQEIADHSGINKALLHYHFKNKETLFRAVFLGALTELLPSIFQKLNENKALEEKVPEAINMYMDRLVANPQLPRFVLNELSQNPDFLLQHIQGLSLKPDVFIQQIDDAIREGRMIPCSPFQVVADIVGLCIFPFVARPVLQLVSGMNAADFKVFVSKRREHVTTLVMRGLFIENVKN